MKYQEKVKELLNNDDIFLNMKKYVDMIEEKNKVMNLTGFTGDTLWKEGVFESIISLEKVFNGELSDKKMLDIGSGVGFPSIPFKIMHPDLDLTIYEPQQKRASFLQEVSKELSLNVEVQVIRVEDVKEKEIFDFITARAVTNLSALIEISSRVGKLNAEYAFVKGPKIIEELEYAKTILEKLDIAPSTIPIKKIEDKTLILFYYEKQTPTPNGYPREWSVISRKNKELFKG